MAVKREAVEAFLDKGPAMLVRVESAKGSTPREAGAWMLVSEKRTLGTIGGGQLEYMAIDAARALLERGAIRQLLDVPLGPEIGQCCGGRTRMTVVRAEGATLERLLALYPGTRFVWLMGADNLANFHRWQDWEEIMCTVPVGVLARPGDRISARMSPAARLFRRYRLPASAAHLLARAEPPAWCFLNVPMMDQSSSAIRAAGEWQGG